MKDQPSYKEQVSTPLERISALLDKSFRINFVEIYEIWWISEPFQTFNT